MSIARGKARSLSLEWGLPQISDPLEWVVGELVTNAVIHGSAMRGSHVAVAYHLDGNHLRVEVRDAATGTPRLTPPLRGDEDAGRGLHLVAALTDAWGVERNVIGKTVWAHLAVTSGEPPDGR
ncbi:ATP-binding protein [Streptomyces sp. NPDC004539]|uniref:ATP-binding protein n=1 Tax=Streptomyces sp. NPDC004539 TaxID=3154280 RepID=UPI0033B049E8